METDVVDIDNKPEIDNSSIMAIDDNQQRDGNKKVVNNNGGCNKGLKRNSNGGGDIEAPRRGRGRPKKVAADSASGSNNNEFYFYSGFGPPRGKRRGDKNDGEDNKSVVALGTSSDDVKVNVGVDVPCSEGLDYFEDYEDEYDDGNGKRRMRKPVKERSLKSLMWNEANMFLRRIIYIGLGFIVVLLLLFLLYNYVDILGGLSII